jgi:thiosulfate reductase cytochrome b subunit
LVDETGLGASRELETRTSQFAEVGMHLPSQRTVFRWIHIIISIPILGYIYSPFEKLPDYAPATRFVFLPTMILTGLWMWKGQVVRRLFSKRPAL